MTYQFLKNNDQILIFCQNLAKNFNLPLATFLKHAQPFLLLIIHKNATKNVKSLLVFFWSLKNSKYSMKEVFLENF